MEEGKLLHSESHQWTVLICLICGTVAGLNNRHGLAVFFGLLIIQCTLEAGFKALRKE